MKKTIKKLNLFGIVFLGFFALSALPVVAKDDTDEAPKEITSLNELLIKVQEEALYDSEENRARIAQFMAEKSTQDVVLQETLANLKVQEDRAVRLEKTFDENDVKLSELEDLKAERLGAFGELFGVVRGTASEMGAQIKESIISGELQGRSKTLTDLAKSKALPSNEELEMLWYQLLEEMNAQGEVKRFNGTIVDTDGNFSEEEVVRVGPWTAFDRKGNFLGYLPDDERYRVLGRQPQARFLDLGDNIVDGDKGDIVKGAIDPSRGAILSLLIQTPGLSERIGQGGIVGYIILGLLAVGLVLSIERIFRLTITARAVNAQAKDVDNPNDSNPLGRVLGAYHSNKSADVETLELKLDDAILKELPSLERGINFIKLLSSVAPLLGLLGTVTGMIVTFQAITLFGTGDPKLMAGGISQALVTTVLGLTAAIPLVLLHSVAQTRSRSIQQILDEQSAGLIAERAESN
ncbi:MAG: flagellar motor protein MotA [Rhodobiaceae bacterium]|nr:flagellar motor protein MotA [Rhodobiaceae bacterium]|tara:strand:+ start:47 stop:1441 length:1395 start_codon:yes stop_codon:yes gene_type:complete